MDDVEKQRQRMIIARIKSATLVRDWSLKIQQEDGGRLFVWQTKDGKKGELTVRIKNDWSCEFVGASGLFGIKQNQTRAVVNDINNELGRTNGRNKTS